MRAFCSDNGVDTVRFRWRGDNEQFVAWTRRPEGTIQGYRGERFIQTPLGRIGAYPDGMMYLETRPAALLVQDRDEHRLAKIYELPTAERVAREFVESEGGSFTSDEPARLGRIDLASELRFQQPQDGSAFLHSLASLDVPWCKSRVDGRKGDHIETVSFHGTRGKTIYLRAYDKGVESDTHPAGMRIRVERQKRYRKDVEPLATDLTISELRAIYLGREFRALANLPSALVADLPQVLDAVIDRARSIEQAERVAGFLTIGGHIEYPRATWYRRKAELRELGLYVDPTLVNERVEVPVGAYLHALASAWAA